MTTGKSLLVGRQVLTCQRISRPENRFRRRLSTLVVIREQIQVGKTDPAMLFQLMAANHRPHDGRFKSGRILLFASPGKNLRATGLHLPQQ